LYRTSIGGQAYPNVTKTCTSSWTSTQDGWSAHARRARLRRRCTRSSVGRAIFLGVASDSQALMGWASPGSRQVKILVPLAIFIVGLLAFVGTHTSGIAAHASAAEAAEVRAAERQARALSERTSFQDHERNRSLEQRSRRELLRAQIREALHRTETSTAALRAELNVSLTELNDALH
jgi:hypothetical protein